jgi:predicted metal-dependent HD superfamily phosphohydrolase
MTQPLSLWLSTLPPEWMEGCDTRAIDRARAAHETAGRHYHTWDHVVACVERLKTFPTAEPRIVFLALVFHDAVYVPGRSDNEQVSAALARETLSSMCAITATELDIIERMILATRDHHALSGTLTADEVVILDLDLSVLGGSRDEYAHYATAIHDEYVPAAATEAQFRIGRTEFLRRMLAMPHVFLTAEGRGRWDDAARANIAWEITELTRRQGFLERWVSAIRRVMAGAAL